MSLISMTVTLAALPLFATLASAQAATPNQTAHTHTQFTFTVEASFEQTAPLFGANEERKWAADWDPQFIHPQPAHDQQGMVFLVEHPGHSSVWVNTAFDLAAGHIQYSYVLNAAMATLIDIHLKRAAADKTEVTVLYERTALTPDANQHVEHFARGDAKAAQEWADAINGYFAKLRSATH